MLFFSLHSLQSCTLYAIFTDKTGRTAWNNYRSSYYILRRAAWLAVYNIKRFTRPVPTYSQLQQHTPNTSPLPPKYPPRRPTAYPPKYPPRHPTAYPPKYPPRRPTVHLPRYPIRGRIARPKITWRH